MGKGLAKPLTTLLDFRGGAEVGKSNNFTIQKRARKFLARFCIQAGLPIFGYNQLEWKG
jgi:hypothetical protein